MNKEEEKQFSNWKKNINKLAIKFDLGKLTSHYDDVYWSERFKNETPEEVVLELSMKLELF